jgi:hypothetical protein
MNGLPHPMTRLPGATRSRNSGVVVEIEVVLYNRLYYCIMGTVLLLYKIESISLLLLVM